MRTVRCATRWQAQHTSGLQQDHQWVHVGCCGFVLQIRRCIPGISGNVSAIMPATGGKQGHTHLDKSMPASLLSAWLYVCFTPLSKKASFDTPSSRFGFNLHGGTHVMPLDTLHASCSNVPSCDVAIVGCLRGSDVDRHRARAGRVERETEMERVRVAAAGFLQRDGVPLYVHVVAHCAS